MAQEQKDNVYLLPRTIDHYQMELTRMLETERYQEAIELLRFLLECNSGDGRADDEWRALHDWLLTLSPELSVPVDEAEELTEEDLLKEHLKYKTIGDPAYVEGLLEFFEKPTAPEKQLLALEQLRHLEHPRIDETIKKWLTRRSLPPYMQFKALQMLKLRGASGTIRIHKNGETVVLELQDTPVRADEFPTAFGDIFDRIQSISMDNDPGLMAFTEQTWEEFLSYLFGTRAYLQLAKEDPAAYDAYAGAFHLMLAESTVGADEQAIRELYGITSELEAVWQRARKLCGAFRTTMFHVF